MREPFVTKREVLRTNECAIDRARTARLDDGWPWWRYCCLQVPAGATEQPVACLLQGAAWALQPGPSRGGRSGAGSVDCDPHAPAHLRSIAAFDPLGICHCAIQICGLLAPDEGIDTRRANRGRRREHSSGRRGPGRKQTELGETK